MYAESYAGKNSARRATTDGQVGGRTGVRGRRAGTGAVSPTAPPGADARLERDAHRRVAVSGDGVVGPRGRQTESRRVTRRAENDRCIRVDPDRLGPQAGRAAGQGRV